MIAHGGFGLNAGGWDMRGNIIHRIFRTLQDGDDAINVIEWSNWNFIVIEPKSGWKDGD